MNNTIIIQQIVRISESGGGLCIDLPEAQSKTIKNLFFPLSNKNDGCSIPDDEEELDFTAASYLAGIEDDEEEDEIWDKFIH